jgi:hypothetical protein
MFRAAETELCIRSPGGSARRRKVRLGHFLGTRVAAAHCTMSDDSDRKRRLIIDRADRMLKQSRTLRNMAAQLRTESNDLMNESRDLRRTAGKTRSGGPRRTKNR